MSNDSIRHNPSTVVNNINEWPLDAHLLLTYRLSTWPVGWDKTDTVRFFTDLDHFRKFHASYQEWARCEDNAWRFTLYLRKDGVSLVLNPDAYIAGALPVVAPMPGSNLDARVTGLFDRTRTVAGAPAEPNSIWGLQSGYLVGHIFKTHFERMWEPENKVGSRETSTYAFPDSSHPKCVRTMFPADAIRIFISEGAYTAPGVSRRLITGGVPADIVTSLELMVFVRAQPDEVVVVNQLMHATHVVDIAAPKVGSGRSGMTLVRPLAHGLGLFALAAPRTPLSIDELRAAIIFEYE